MFGRTIIKALLAFSIGILSMPVLGDEVSDEWLSAVAGTPIRLFDPTQSGVENRFQSFMRDTVMVNGRQVPPALASAVAARIRFYQRLSSARDPTYFVASYIDRLDAQFTSSSAQAGRYRYGEPIYPQAVCPIFAAHSDASVPELLATATGLPAALFEQAPGERDRLHTLFMLTEASHCAFLSRELGDTSLRSPILRSDLVSLIEAIGDIEAIDAFRREFGVSSAVDEGDVLLAARIVALFSSRKQNVYSLIPAFTVDFDERGFAAAAGQVASHKAAVTTARQIYFSIAGSRRRPARHLGALLQQAQSVRDALASDDAARDLEPMTRTLLSLFPAAVDVLANASSEAGMLRAHRTVNRTLPGAGRRESRRDLAPADII